MKCYTVSLAKIINAVSPIPKDLVTPGIDVKMNPAGLAHQFYLGDASYGNMAYVDNAFTNGAKVEGDKIFDAHPIQANVGKFQKWFTVRPHANCERSDILVRIHAFTMRSLGLLLGRYTEGVKVIAVGTGYDKKKQEWADALVVIPPYETIIITKGTKEIFAVVNSGGNPMKKGLEPKPMVITAEDYAENFVAHINACVESNPRKKPAPEAKSLMTEPASRIDIFEELELGAFSATPVNACDTELATK